MDPAVSKLDDQGESRPSSSSEFAIGNSHDDASAGSKHLVRKDIK
jgi:hypothetical protein